MYKQPLSWPPKATQTHTNPAQCKEQPLCLESQVKVMLRETEQSPHSLHDIIFVVWKETMRKGSVLCGGSVLTVGPLL